MHRDQYRRNDVGKKEWEILVEPAPDKDACQSKAQECACNVEEDVSFTHVARVARLNQPLTANNFIAGKGLGSTLAKVYHLLVTRLSHKLPTRGQPQRS